MDWIRRGWRKHTCGLLLYVCISVTRVLICDTNIIHFLNTNKKKPNLFYCITARAELWLSDDCYIKKLTNPNNLDKTMTDRHEAASTLILTLKT